MGDELAVAQRHGRAAYVAPVVFGGGAGAPGRPAGTGGTALPAGCPSPVAIGVAVQTLRAGDGTVVGKVVPAADLLAAGLGIEPFIEAEPIVEGAFFHLGLHTGGLVADTPLAALLGLASPFGLGASRR